MDTPRESSRSFRSVFAMFAATVTVASAGWLMMGASNAAAPEKMSVAANGVERGLDLKDWELLAK